MSSRQFRKMNQRNNVPPPPDDSDDDYQPLYAQRSGFSNYAGLDVGSSHSESERVSERSEDEAQNNVNAPPPGIAPKKKNFKKKGKGKGRHAMAYGLDEVERSVREVNAMLGSPPPAPTKKSVNQALEVLDIDPKHLNVANELRRFFGPEEGAQNRRARVPPNRALLLKRVLIHPNKETPAYDFNNFGWSMMKYKEVGDRSYFVFNHSEAYQKMHRNFLRRLAIARNSGDIVANFEEAKKKMHVEALLEIADRLFRMEENGVGNEIVENVVTFLQYVADPLFILSKNNVRLEYKFLENRPFHVAMLKYIYLLTNKACHRTALEIAKMLLLIDPSDPLVILNVIDILALRAREHEWLIEAMKYFDRQREATMLFNIKYSLSLAHFHVALKNNGDFAEADRLIREAILAFPHIFVKILECCHISNPELLGHEIFKPDPPKPWSVGASEVFMMYAKMTYPRWNEPAVMKWLMKNATELCAEYNINKKIKRTAIEWSISRHRLYDVWPQEDLRHLSVFSSMSKLIIESAFALSQPTCAFDPLFHKSVNRYEYSYKLDAPRTPSYAAGPAGGSSLYSADDRRNNYQMINLIAQQNGNYPYMYRHTAGAHGGHVHIPPMGTAAVYFRPPAHNFNRNGPNVNHQWQALYEHGIWNMQGINMHNLLGPCNNPRFGIPTHPHFPPHYPLPSRDLAFDDNDPAFEPYDYADDETNFAVYDEAMAAAMANSATVEEMYSSIEDLSDAIDAVCFDVRINNIFRPTNAN